jgi:hypothetical protein
VDLAPDVAGVAAASNADDFDAVTVDRGNPDVAVDVVDAHPVSGRKRLCPAEIALARTLLGRRRQCMSHKRRERDAC